MPTPTYDLLASSVLTSSASSVTFDNISQDYRDLILVVQGTQSLAASSPVLRFNGDTASNYFRVLMKGNGTSATSTSETLNGVYIGDANVGETLLSIANIMDYSATDKHKTVLARVNNPADNTLRGTEAHAQRWANTSAITSIVINDLFSGSFDTGTTFYLYGIAS